MKLRRVLLFILLIFTLQGVVFAAEPPKPATNVDISALENFSQRLQQDMDYLPDISVSRLIENYKQTGSIGVAFGDFVNSFLRFMFNEVVSNSRLLVELLFIGILCAVLQNIQSSFDGEGVAKIAYYACFLIMVMIIIKSFTVTMQIGRDTINNMIEFTNAMMPPLMVLLASVGGFASAATLDPIMMLVIKVISDVIRDIVLPMTILIVILNIVNSLSDTVKISKLAGLVKQINLWILGFIMTVFVAFVTIRSSTSATLDQVTLKSAKFAVDNFIPFVGKALSDAITTVAGYSLILKDAVSIVGLVIMLFICVFPLIKIIIISLIYKFVGAVMEPVVDKKVVECLTAAGNSFTIVFACVLSVAIMFFIMITIIASTGKLITLVG